MPSSSRLYIAPDGQLATHEGFRQCSQMRGRKNMNACSYVMRTCSSMPAMCGSRTASSGPPARPSSQFGPHVTSIGSPVSCECGRATGSRSESGAVTSVS
jgi:hypothetical protein